MAAAMPWRTRATTHGRYRLGSATRTSSTRCVTPNLRRIDLRTSGDNRRSLRHRPLPRFDSEQFRSAPKASHASTHKHLRCQTLTSLSFGDKRLFREVSKPEQLEIPVGLLRERAFVWHHRGHGNSAEARLRRDDPHRASCPAAGRDREGASRNQSRGSSYSLTRRSDVRFREQTGKTYARSEPYRLLPQRSFRKHSLDLPIGLCHGPRNGSVVSSLHCMNDPNWRVTCQATSDDENS